MNAQVPASRPLLDMRSIGKAFGPVVVLDDVSLSCAAGEVHAICGENGAGKSTLMKILGGVYTPDQGEIVLDGIAQSFAHPIDAREAGIGIIHQELSLLPHRTVAENIFVGREPSHAGRIDRAALRRQTLDVLARVGSSIDPDTECGRLSIAEQQVVEIAKALSLDARILVLDEPTAPLDNVESAKLFRLIDELREHGVALLYISHRMAEVFDVADRITVLKDGKRMGVMPVAEASVDQVVRMMVGRDVRDFYPPRASTPPGPPVITLRGAGNDTLFDIDLEIHAGEIVGIAGLESSGKIALARALFGETPFTRGEIHFIDGGGAPRHAREATRRGIGYLPDDRKRDGLGLRQSLRDNAALAVRSMARALSSPTRRSASHDAIDALLKRVDVRAAHFGLPVEALSGGNQQKVVIARWLAREPKLWIVCEPTRGIDVVAKATVYRILRDYADAGGAVLMVSSDVTEVIGLSDRIGVMAAGRLVAMLPAGASEEAVIAHAVQSHQSLGEPEAMQ
ncbi:sugar ABC transporter ATP-binding protein [Pararobbsia alpina]|uniref:sugar ABC transporter ATP-binding protein n=1 Tax=Pararobbsia alpina TaxID=621374 RepID=UPI0039A74007